MRRTLRAAVIALLCFTPRAMADPVDVARETGLPARSPVIALSEPSALLMLGMSLLAVAKHQRNRKIGVR